MEIQTSISGCTWRVVCTFHPHQGDSAHCTSSSVLVLPTLCLHPSDKMKYEWKITLTSDCQGDALLLSHPRGSDLPKASSDVAQQHELSAAFSEKWLWETSAGVSAQGFKAIFKLRPWPGLLSKSVHSSQSQLCSPLSDVVGTLGEVAACSPLPQPCCVLTLSNIPSGALQSWKPQMACVLLFTQHTELMP